ncbi:AmmeMemoRadiSam system protein B [Aliiglaciecola sp. CAU 1673]|uniref:AmmeMemoRadiSam system protein B n=1 Tax=Aliiglaciecola sp. CAU 1673 TaxID=3032595 RepID=UPI0023DABE0F|nr:AmmeMemoRadiSam system protein B [Aliiglaciecola sp. CAU 1673]MDF2178400.1 AmmeMemoRadiSam system protein B [Aliiglaciecola sp. CAU 1673]
MHCRAPAVAGRFYPMDSRKLQQTVVARLSEAHPPISKSPPKALIVPHAGYMYSGAVAAEAYACLPPIQERFREIVLLGPCHYQPLQGLALPSQEAFSTPLGEVSIHQGWRQLALNHPQVSVDDNAHRQEHSLEVQLPFLQCCLQDFEILPMVVGHATPEMVKQVLSSLPLSENSLLVISTDLSHFHSYEEARQLDELTVSRILQCDQHIRPQQACGAYALDGALAYCQSQGWQPQLLKLCSSGDVSADKDRVVGYASFVLH